MITAALSGLTEGVGIPMAERAVVYPSAFTDREWKKTEKTLQVSGTGIGKAVRAMEQTATDLDKALVRAKTLQAAASQSNKAREDSAKTLAKESAAAKAVALIPALHAKHLKAILATRTIVTATQTKLKTTNRRASVWLSSYEDSLEAYFKLWRLLDLKENPKVKRATDEIDNRIRTLLPDRLG